MATFLAKQADTVKAAIRRERKMAVQPPHQFQNNNNTNNTNEDIIRHNFF